MRTFNAELPAVAKFQSPVALCSAAAPLPASARAPVRAKKLVRVECPAFFTRPASGVIAAASR